MLKDWLVWSKRPEEPPKVAVIDCKESCALPGPVLAHIGELLVSARINPEFLQDAAEKLGWADVSAFALAMRPRIATMRRGNFGEAVSCAMLEQWHSYKIPVYKLRYAITPDQSQPGTDAIAVRIDAADRITEVAFIESKLRTGRAVGVPLQGYQQLQADYDKRVSEALMFVAQRLHESHSPLYEPFMVYLRSRAVTNIDRFKLFLVWELERWAEESLEMIDEHEPKLEGTEIHLVRINGLAAVVDDIYRRMEITVVDDDDAD